MDIRQLKYFAAIVEEGNISAAARALHVSQPPLSYQMNQLEEELGVRLFIRGSRQIILTDAGKLLYQYAREILELEKAATEDMKNLENGKQGSVRIGVVSSAYDRTFFDRLNHFHHIYPDIRFQVSEGNTYELLEDLDHLKIELAVVRTPFNEHEYDCRFFCNDCLYAAGYGSSLKGLSAEITLADLKKEPLLIYRRWDKIIRTTFNEEKIRPNIAGILDDARTCLEWASAGLGTALVPGSILPFFKDAQASRLKEEAFQTRIGIIKRKESVISFGAQTLFDMFH